MKFCITIDGIELRSKLKHITEGYKQNQQDQLHCPLINRGKLIWPLRNFSEEKFSEILRNQICKAPNMMRQIIIIKYIIQKTIMVSVISTPSLMIGCWVNYRSFHEIWRILWRSDTNQGSSDDDVTNHVHDTGTNWYPLCIPFPSLSGILYREIGIKNDFYMIYIRKSCSLWFQPSQSAVVSG